MKTLKSSHSFSVFSQTICSSFSHVLKFFDGRSSSSYLTFQLTSDVMVKDFKAFLLVILANSSAKHVYLFEFLSLQRNYTFPVKQIPFMSAFNWFIFSGFVCFLPLCIIFVTDIAVLLSFDIENQRLQSQHEPVMVSFTPEFHLSPESSKLLEQMNFTATSLKKKKRNISNTCCQTLT